MFFVCLVGVWQRNFEPVVCECVRYDGLGTADCSPLSTGILYGCLQRVTIPEAVVIQFVLLRMSGVLLETC